MCHIFVLLSHLIFFSSYCIYLLVWFIDLILLSHLIFKLHRVSWLISYCLFHLIFLSLFSYFDAVPFLLSYWHFFFLLHLFNELILFNYSSQTLLGLFLMFPDSLFPDVSRLCHIFVTFLSPSVTLYKREGVWTDD